jgi:hypothetical protein
MPQKALKLTITVNFERHPSADPFFELKQVNFAGHQGSRIAKIHFFLIPVNRKNTGPSRSVSAVPAADGGGGRRNGRERALQDPRAKRRHRR